MGNICFPSPLKYNTIQLFLAENERTNCPKHRKLDGNSYCDLVKGYPYIHPPLSLLPSGWQDLLKYICGLQCPHCSGRTIGNVTVIWSKATSYTIIWPIMKEQTAQSIGNSIDTLVCYPRGGSAQLAGPFDIHNNYFSTRMKQLSKPEEARFGSCYCDLVKGYQLYNL